MSVRGYEQVTGAIGEPVAGRVAVPVAAVRKKPTGRKVLRRLKGFVVALDDSQARVAFVQDGTTILYDLPAESLKKKGIIALHQPFEMDEISLKVEPYDAVTAYEFRPLAARQDAYPETLPLDAERAKKRDLIFRKFKKAAG